MNSYDKKYILERIREINELLEEVEQLIDCVDEDEEPAGEY